MTQKVTRRRVETTGADQYELRTKKDGPIAVAVKDYTGGPTRAWSWKLADGLAWRYGDGHTKTEGTTYSLSDAVATVQARFDAYGIKTKRTV